MIEQTGFNKWLHDNTSYSEASIKDVISRMNRADKILQWKPLEAYLYYLDKNTDFARMSVSVKSQMRKAVRLYNEYYETAHGIQLVTELTNGEK